MTNCSQLSIGNKPKKSTKMPVIYKLSVRMTKKSNQHIAGVYVNVDIKYEVSIIMCVGRRANQ